VSEIKRIQQRNRASKIFKWRLGRMNFTTTCEACNDRASRFNHEILQPRLVLILTILHFSCTSPVEHSNPLDPESPAFSELGKITGTVTTYYQPFRPLENVEVRISPGPQLALTNNRGEFEFSGLHDQDYKLHAALPGYASDTLLVKVPRREAVTVTMRLNGVPQVDSVKIVTARIASQTDSTFFFLEVKAFAGDPDGVGDVRRLTLIARDFAFTDSLTLVDRNGVWQRRFGQDELPNVSLPAWLGHPLHIRAEDFLRQQTMAGPFFISRVMQETPETIAPIDSAVNRSPLRFIWRNNPVAYPHTQEVEIFRIVAGFPGFYAAIRRISAGANNAVFPGGVLPPSGNYFWTIKIVDEFGNWSRSKEAAFRVERP